ncbi:DUF1304 domain-containing protein [Paenibacillus oenotherae]|uniref:DUF1304 domain-containing protein n=1 Tax=Paenibacillus oenotherae TaxID=1435645 RepID=A0ABS7D6B1_9BACL|nr:DUF1304 domain-containing protein [Paenibacillus oenotherae]MBW7475477.1 DUF1304 domain-containing protein [Paenibacillus oenotherae]
MISNVFVAIVALEHVYILVLEMFLWTSPRAMRAFGTDKLFAEQTRSLAANQGLYNGFLAAGLVWGLLHPNDGTGDQIQLFFLCCVLAAAIYGGLSAKRSILIIQGLPALAALLLLLLT